MKVPSMLLLVLLSVESIAQCYLPRTPASDINLNNTAPGMSGCLASGSYNTVTWNGVLTIKAGEDVTINTMRMSVGAAPPGVTCRLIVEKGAKLTVLNEYDMNGSVYVQGSLTVYKANISTGYFVVDGDATVKAESIHLKGVNNEIAGQVNTTFFSMATSYGILVPDLKLTGCGYLVTSFMDNDAENAIKGTGFLKLNNYSGRSLTADSTITVEYTGSGSPAFGAAARGTYKCEEGPVQLKYIPNSLQLKVTPKL